MIELAEIESARERIAGVALRTPLVRLQVDEAPAEIYLKLENLQPINSFKIRGATNAVLLAPPGERAKGLVTASAGNMAQGWPGRRARSASPRRSSCRTTPRRRSSPRSSGSAAGC